MLFVGDDWAEDHHDIEVEDEAGQRLARQRLPEGLAGISRLHALIAACMPAEWADLPEGEAAGRVKVGIETERGPWVQALVAAGYEVFALNPVSVARYRERHSTSGAKSDAADAHLAGGAVPTTASGRIRRARRNSPSHSTLRRAEAGRFRRSLPSYRDDQRQQDVPRLAVPGPRRACRPRGTLANFFAPAEPPALPDSLAPLVMRKPISSVLAGAKKAHELADESHVSASSERHGLAQRGGRPRRHGGAWS